MNKVVVDVKRSPETNAFLEVDRSLRVTEGFVYVHEGFVRFWLFDLKGLWLLGR